MAPAHPHRIPQCSARALTLLLLLAPALACRHERKLPEPKPMPAGDAGAAPTELDGVIAQERFQLEMLERQKPQPELLSLRAQHRAATERESNDPNYGTKIRAKKDARPPTVSRLIVGDGWGCSGLEDDGRYCWQAPGAKPTQDFVLAHHIAQFDGPWWILPGPDRICMPEWRKPSDCSTLGDGQNGSTLPHSSDCGKNSMRCWPAPDFIRQLNPAPPSQEIARIGSWEVTLYDDFDGAQGSVDAPCDHASYDQWLEAPRLCKRNFGLRLCRLGPAVVPCAVVDADTLRGFLPKNVAAGDRTGGAIAGDLFTCKADRDNGIWCIGASRDGFFGSREECPTELLSAWPTQGGPIVAPNARCARFPVRIGNGRYRGVIGSAGPRGLCLERELDAWHTEYECFGGVRIPPTRMARLVVGLGDEPSACGLSENLQVSCWGAGYNADPRTPAPVPIRFDLPEQALAIDGAGPFHTACGIHHRCSRGLREFSICPAQQHSYSIDELLGLVEGFAGQRVTVRGALALHPVMTYGMASIACGPFKQGGKATPDLKKGGGYGAFCCPGEGNADVGITNGRAELYLDGFFCSGDTSRSCCNIAVLGQEVQVTGTLYYRESAVDIRPGFSLAEPEICQTLRDDDQ